MITAKKAAFAFEDYSIPEFSFIKQKNEDEELEINFEASGVFDNDSKSFELTLDVIGNEEGKQGEAERPVFRIKFVGKFVFNDVESLDEVPDFFYPNALGIIFPYIRAFISTLTLQSNSSIIVLELVNLTNLVEPLKANVTIK